MAKADHTAYACPGVSSAAASCHQPATPPSEITGDDVRHASMTVAQVLFHGVAALNDSKQPKHKHLPPLVFDADVVSGLTVTLRILDTEEEALRRREGPGA